jgi:hypothetical protein
MRNGVFLAFVFFILCGLARAEENKGGFFLEPSVTYEQGDGNIDFSSSILKDSDSDINGFGAGIRLGFHVYESLFVGVDGRYAIPNFKDSSLDQDIKATTYNYGPVIGVQMPTSLAIRLWGTYIMGSELDPDKDQGVDEKFTDGQGYRLGGGVKLGFVSLNLEYQYIKYDNTTIQDAGPINSADLNKVRLANQSWILSVSFPVSL